MKCLDQPKVSLFQRCPLREIPLYNAPNVKWSIGVLCWQFVWQKECFNGHRNNSDFVLLFDKRLLLQAIVMKFVGGNTHFLSTVCVSINFNQPSYFLIAELHVDQPICT